MKFQLQSSEILYGDFMGQRREANSISGLFKGKNENGHIYITSHRVVFTTTQGLLCIVGNLTDLFFPSLQDISVEILMTDIVGLNKKRIMNYDCTCIKCKTGTEYIFYAGNGLNNKSGEIMRLVQDACNKLGVVVNTE